MIKTNVQNLTIPEDFQGQRIDNFLFTRLKKIPKTHIYRILRKGEVRVNKKRIQPNYRLQAGDIVRIPPLEMSDKPVSLSPSEKIKSELGKKILFEDEQLLIINKPSGLPVHGGSQVKLGIIEILRNVFPQFPHLELAHRLDADTSGVLILAKKRSALRKIHELLRTGNIEKIYWTLTKGEWKSNELRVEVSLQKNILQSGERVVKVNPEGKESITEFSVLKNFSFASLMQAKLLTGRTHQIRVHAQYRKHFIAGDEKYGDKEFNKKMRALGLKRLFLHAYSIAFELDDKTIKVQAPLDEELKDCLDSCSVER